MVLDVRLVDHHARAGEPPAAPEPMSRSTPPGPIGGCALRARCIQRRLGILQVLAGHEALGNQRLTALVLRACTRLVGFRVVDLGAGARDVGAPHRQHRARHALARVQLPHHAHGIAERRFGGLEARLCVGAVELHQRLPLLHELGIVGVNRDDRAAHLRRHLHDVAAHIGVVGEDAAALEHSPVTEGTQPCERRDAKHRQHPAPAAYRRRGRRSRGPRRARLRRGLHGLGRRRSVHVRYLRPPRARGDGRCGAPARHPLRNHRAVRAISPAGPRAGANPRPTARPRAAGAESRPAEAGARPCAVPWRSTPGRHRRRSSSLLARRIKPFASNPSDNRVMCGLD